MKSIGDIVRSKKITNLDCENNPVSPMLIGVINTYIEKISEEIEVDLGKEVKQEIEILKMLNEVLAEELADKEMKIGSATSKTFKTTEDFVDYILQTRRALAEAKYVENNK